MLAHLLFRSAGLPARDNFRRPCVYHYPVDRRSSQNYFFTFCSVSLYGFQGTMLSVQLFASLRQLRYYITPLPLCQHFFRSLDFLDYFPFFPLFHSLFCTFLFILQINILRFLRNIFCFLLFYLSARIRSKACPLPILLHCFIIGLYFYEFVVNAANAKLSCDINGVDAIS